MKQRVINTPASIYLESRKRTRAFAVAEATNNNIICNCIVELESEVDYQVQVCQKKKKCK